MRTQEIKYHVGHAPRHGLATISKPGDAGLRHLGFGLLVLKKGEKHALQPSANETALVLLNGKAGITAPGISRQTIGPRSSLFTERPWTVYLPSQTACDIEALGDVEIAVCQATSARRGDAYIVPDAEGTVGGGVLGVGVHLTDRLSARVEGTLTGWLDTEGPPYA